MRIAIRWFLVAATLLVACGRCHSRPAGPVRISGQLSLKPGVAHGKTIGNAAIYWLSATEWEDWQHGRHLLRIARTLMQRVVALKAVDPGTGPVPFQITADEPDAFIFGILDVRGEFLPTLLGEGGQGNLTGQLHLDGASAQLVLDKEIPPPRERRCEGPGLRSESLPAPPLAGNPEPMIRRVCVHLPADYDSAIDRHYPVIYALPGLLSAEVAGSLGLLNRVADSMAGTKSEAIIVGVDTSTKWGSTYLEPAALEGDLETFLARDVVARIDTDFRTIADPKQRALFGQSTGGFNAVSMALRHSDVFQTLVASSPDALDFESWFVAADGRHVNADWLAWARTEAAFGPPGQLISYAAAWSPDGHGGFLWPASLDTGELIPEVWARWKRASPVELLKQPSIANAVRSRLSGRIYLVSSPADEAGLYPPATRFSQALAAAGIVHSFASDDGGHFQTEQRVRGMLEFAFNSFAK